MKDFFVHASSQMDESERFMYEQRLERTVMSEEYDSAKRGKPAEWTSAMIAAAETVKM